MDCGSRDRIIEGTIYPSGVPGKADPKSGHWAGDGDMGLKREENDP